MTLCIAFRDESGALTALSDSQLTVSQTSARWVSNAGEDATGAAVSTLPSNAKILHRGHHSVKVQIASQAPTIYGSRDTYDLVFSIAGNVSLGLQSVMYLDAWLKGTSYSMWVDAIKN